MKELIFNLREFLAGVLMRAGLWVSPPPKYLRDMGKK